MEMFFTRRKHKEDHAWKKLLEVKMKKILFALCVLLFVVLLDPRHIAAEAPSSTPVPDALVAEALAAKQASYPTWVG